MTEECFIGDDVLAEADKCVRLIAEQTGTLSTWCVILKKSVFSCSYVYGGQEDRLRDKLVRDHKVVAVLGISAGMILGKVTDYRVASPEVPVNGLRRSILRRAVYGAVLPCAFAKAETSVSS